MTLGGSTNESTTLQTHATRIRFTSRRFSLSHLDTLGLGKVAIVSSIFCCTSGYPTTPPLREMASEERGKTSDEEGARAGSARHFPTFSLFYPLLLLLQGSRLFEDQL